MCAAPSVVLAVVVALALLAAYAASRREQFFTPHGSEEPTRSYTPYTGTLPFGPWGARPWAEAVPDGLRRGCGSF
jgi:hypothetical protein